MNNPVNIIVVGGGPSGLAAAVSAARTGASVTVLEQNRRPGKKLLVTGNGRCNLTNSELGTDSYRGTHPEFAYEVLAQFGQRDAVAFFLSLGIYTLSHDGWLYPYNEQASSVLEALLAECRHLRVKIKNSEKVLQILPKAEGFGVRTDGWEYACDRVILACGSSASEIEGSDGSGYAPAKALGHTLIPEHPALTNLICDMKENKNWSGVRVTARLILLADGEILSVRTGQLQLTDSGISGIPAFQVSRYASEALAAGKDVRVRINFMPDFEKEALETFLGAIHLKCPYKSLAECLDGIFQSRLAAVLSAYADNLETLTDAICHFELKVTGTGDLKHSQTAAGGIDTAEVDPATMESRLVPGLYFGGEMLDIDGDCGGYNLQWDWSTGVIAGRSAAGVPISKEDI